MTSKLTFSHATAVLLGAALALVAPATSSADVSFPYLDLNGNGQHDAGDSGDITGQINAGQVVSPGGIVIPQGIGLLRSRSGDLQLWAQGGDIIVESDLRARASVSLRSSGGAIVVGDGVTIRAGRSVRLHGYADVAIGAAALVKASAPHSGGFVGLFSDTGSVVIAEDSTIKAQKNVRILAEEGPIVIMPGVTLSARWRRSLGNVNVHAGGDVSSVGVTILASSLTVATEADLVEFRSNRVNLPQWGGYVVLAAAGSTVDLTATEFTPADAVTLIVSADTVID